MPGIRIQYIRGPIWGKTAEQLRRDTVLGNNPLTGNPILDEIVSKLTKPLTAEEKRTDEVNRGRGPETFTGTTDELQKLFLEKRFTDFMPIILPTEEKVAEMLKGTSHDPDEVLGTMSPHKPSFESWTYTVKIAAINAVMAGAKPEYLPVILAIGSTGSEAISVSDNSFVYATKSTSITAMEQWAPTPRPIPLLEEHGVCCLSMEETAARSETPTWVR